MAGKKKDAAVTIEIPKPQISALEIAIVGTSPFICERMSEKAKHELLLPKGRKTAAEKATSLKHDPLAEYRASAYTLEEGSPTLLGVKAAAFKGAMTAAAKDVPGATKAQTGRLLWVNGETIPMYGTPKILLSVTRSADINKTPDIRTRAIVPRWAVELSVSFVTPQLTHSAVANLLSMAGFTIGVGGWRVEKGSGNFGQFRVCDLSDPEFQEIAEEGYAAQLAAMETPEAYDQETSDLLGWYVEETDRRGVTVTA